MALIFLLLIDWPLLAQQINIYAYEITTNLNCSKSGLFRVQKSWDMNNIQEFWENLGTTSCLLTQFLKPFTVLLILLKKYITNERKLRKTFIKLTGLGKPFCTYLKLAMEAARINLSSVMLF